MARLTEIEWNHVELLYRAGIRSLKDIGAEFNVSDAAILKRAKRDKWTRDLQAKIRVAAEAKVSESLVSAKVSSEKKASEKDVVEANATMQADIILAHRTDIQRNRTLAKKLLEELEQVSDNVDLFEQLGELIIDPNTDDPSDKSSKAQQDRQYKRLEAFNRALDMSSRIDSLKKLSDTLKTLIALEREAFGLDERKNNDSQVTYNMQF